MGRHPVASALRFRWGIENREQTVHLLREIGEGFRGWSGRQGAGRLSRKGFGRDMDSDLLQLGGKKTGVSPRQGFETEIESAVEFVERDAHIEAGFGSGEPRPARGFHDRDTVEVEPADRGGIDSLDGDFLFSFEPGTERSDAVLDEVEAGALHDIIFGMFGGGDDFFGNAKGGADFGAREFPVFEELQISGGEARLDDFGGIPEQQGAVGSAGAAFASAQSGEELLALRVVELLTGADDEAAIGVVLDETVHEGSGGEIGFGGEAGGMERGKTAPEIHRVGKFLEPDFFGEEELGWDGGAMAGAVVTPALELMIFNDGQETGGVEHENAFESGPIGEGGAILAEDGDAEAFAAEHEPEDAEFPILEAVDGGMGPRIKIEQRPGGDESFAAALAAGEKERDIGDLFGEDVDGAIDPGDLLVGIAEGWAGGLRIAAEPGESRRRI